MTDSTRKLDDFIKVVKMLRSDSGCPWDRKQTPYSLKRYLQEETRELLEAIDAGDPQHIKEESGDLLYILVLLAQIHSEKNYYAMDDVIEAISAKMVRRHPHVFQDEKTGSAAELRKKWLQIKESEKEARTKTKKN